MFIALKVDVDTYRGTREGVPRLVDLLKRHAAGATFLFSLGPDHTGRALKRAFHPGFASKVRRTSVLEHYGLRTLLYGTLLPGPDIGMRCGDVMRSVAADGFEVGIHAWDHVKWQDGVASAGEAWTRRQMQLAVDRFTSIFGASPHIHGAAGWRMNIHALRLTQRFQFAYCSDARGSEPFLPVYRAELIRCPQLPTTLPTLDELIGRDGINESNVAQHMLDLTEKRKKRYEIYTLHAELEGMKLAPIFETLLSGWKRQGYGLVSLQQIFSHLDIDKLPRHEIVFAEIAGRSGKLLVQGPRFLEGLANEQDSALALTASTA